MSARLRSTALLAATLVVGIVIGAAGSREIARLWLPGGPPRAEGGGDDRSNAGDGSRDDAGGPFVTTMERAIQPRDSAQRAAVHAIIVQTAQSNRVAIQSANQTLRAAVDSMRLQLAPLLDEEQRTRLDEAMRRLPPIGPRGGPPGGPPRGRGGPGGPRPEGGRPAGPPPGAPR